MSNVANRINLYGLDEDYRIVRYASVLRELLTSTRLMIEAISLRDTFGGIESVYAVEDCEDVREACHDSLKNHSMEDRVIFKCLLDSDGIKLI